MPINILDNETVIGTLSSSSTIYDGNGGNSAQWDGAVNNITGLQSLSGNWQSTYATVCALSSNWSAAYASTTALNLSSGKWNNVFTLINTTTATTFNVNNLSATGTVYANSISTTTISANNTFSSGNQYVISDGVGNNNTGNGANTISLNAVSGTYIGSNLTIKGNLSATGNVISSGSWANSVYTGISGDGVLIDYLQGSPGLGRISVGNGTGTDSLAFYSNGPAYSPTTSTLYLSANGLVGINTNAPNQQLTVVGNISATGNLYGTLANVPYTLNTSTSSIVPTVGINTASGVYSNVGGGQCNTVTSNCSFIGGGLCNNISTAGGFASIVGGFQNNTTRSNFTFIAGGSANSIGAGSQSCIFTSNIIGGFYNCIQTGFTGRTICNSNIIGGANNIITNSTGTLYTNYNNSIIGGNLGYISGNTTNSSIVGGCCNCLFGATYTTIAGGACNTASGGYSFIAAGSANNTNNLSNTFILGSNILASQSNFTYVNNLSSLGTIYGGNIYSNGVLLTNSGGSSNVDTGVRALTGNWQSTYATVCALSANWNTAYNITTAYQSVSSTFATNSTITNNYLPLSGGTITGQLKVNGVVTASGSNVNINVVNTSSNWIFSNADNNKAIHFNTNSSVLTASIPSGLQAGFNVALMNTGTNSVILSSQTTLFASGSSVASGFGGALIYTDSSNNVFAVGRLF